MPFKVGNDTWVHTSDNRMTIRAGDIALYGHLRTVTETIKMSVCDGVSMDVDGLGHGEAQFKLMQAELQMLVSTNLTLTSPSSR